MKSKDFLWTTCFHNKRSIQLFLS